MPRPVCPKCSGFLMPKGDLIDCLNCGHVIIRDPLVVMDMPVKRPEKPLEVASKNELICRKYEKSIRKMRKEKTAWANIARLVSIDEKATIKEKSLYKTCLRLGVV